MKVSHFQLSLLNSLFVFFFQKEHWTYEPFSAHKTENGNIYARGSQVKNIASICTSMAIELIGSFWRMGGSRKMSMSPYQLGTCSIMEGGGVLACVAGGTRERASGGGAPSEIPACHILYGFCLPPTFITFDESINK